MQTLLFTLVILQVIQTHNLSFDVSAQQFNFTNKVIASNGRLSSVESNGSDVDKVNFQLSGTTLTITTS